MNTTHEDMTMDRDKFVEALSTFVVGCLDIAEAHRKQFYPNLPAITLETMPGKRYIRIVRGDVSNGQRSVHCFVDQTNGDVLKAAGWKAPAKHARGNIFDEHNGLGSMGEYGPAYLR
jgi:hypothetical protein